MDAGSESVNDRGRKILQELHKKDGFESEFEEISKILSDFRVLTREKTLSPDVLDVSCITCLVNYSKECHTEAQKSLSNLILNYAHIREPLVEPYTECVKNRLTEVSNNEFDIKKVRSSKKQLNEVLYYDLRIIFLLSALCPNSRAGIRDQLFDLIFHVIAIQADDISDDDHSLIIEGLKTLFNLTIDKCINKTLAGDVIKKLFESIQDETMTIIDSEAKQQPNQLLVNLINLLTNMPNEVYLKLTSGDVTRIIDHLDNLLKTYSKQNFRDSILPVLNVCANICKYNEEIRRNLFDQIMGSSQDFNKRPEEYDTLRGRLVKLMTSVDVHIKDIAADFLFALCGSDTEKFITYTGFGNSAAYLAARGLLSQSLRNDVETADRSKNDAEYMELRDKLDPITGKIDVPKVNPMEGMSEEEKEYHANELANAITRLTNLGVMKPMQINADGKVSDIIPKDSDKETD